MSTIAEIEAAIEALPPEQVRELAAWLEARKEKPVAKPKEKLPMFGFMKGAIILKPGWDEPLEDFKEYME
ncbi:MAG: DUF2281 domain-containing protein [Verrucomicrobiae bacterium]|nr:DUF2281 domain-containing protein [Verrucomicrobiae bacterium]